MSRKHNIGSIPEKLLTTGEIARYCHTSVMQVNRWIKNSDLKSFRNPGGQNRILISDFRNFLEKNGMPVLDEFFGPSARKKILVADDDSTMTGAIRHLLQSQLENIDIEVTNDGYETLIKVGDFKPDVLILDIRMPKVDGMEICRRLRANKNVNPVRILVVTGYSGEFTAESVINNGADDFLLKPFDKEELISKISALINK